MKAIVVTEHGGPEALEMSQSPTPSPGTGEVLIDVSAVGVNYIDVYHRTGLYPIEPPFTPGLEGSGIVAELGHGVTELAVGDQVAWSQVPGSYAAQVVAPVSALLPVPTDVPPTVAAAVLLQGLTAEYLSSSTHSVAAGDEVLIHAGAGGVGLLLTQLVKLRGGRVITTVSTDDKAELSKEAGADEVIGYEDFADRVRRLTDGRGVDVVYDGVGRATFEGGLASLRPRGLMALFGQASGPVPPVDPQTLAKHGSLYLTRPIGAHYLGPKEFRRRADGLFSLISSGDLSVRIGGEYSLDQAQQAHEDLEARRTTGKLLLVPLPGGFVSFDDHRTGDAHGVRRLGGATGYVVGVQFPYSASGALGEVGDRPDGARIDAGECVEPRSTADPPPRRIVWPPSTSDAAGESSARTGRKVLGCPRGEVRSEQSGATHVI